jgi:UDP-N-acetylmuramoyl-L-alanyl-D-glutamate--2,6-diaminopimelate ligase
MKALSNIIPSKLILQHLGAADCDVTGLTLDSRKVQSGFLFAAIKGTLTDGHTYIEKAIELGASVILVETLPTKLNASVAYLVCADVMEVLGQMAAAYYDHPSEKLKIIGVTGTNGKTTVCSLLFDLFEQMGFACGLISTVVNKVHLKAIPTTHTTPDVVTLNELFALMVEEGCTYAFMEVSSHALHQKRVAGVNFSGAVFTNLTHDHLDYHGTFDHYRDAKKLLFDNLSRNGFVLTNKDDKNGMFMVQNTKAPKYTYGMNVAADFKGRLIENDFEGMLLQVGEIEAWYHLVGKFNASNLLAVYGVAFLLDFEPEEIIRNLTILKRVEGRFETLRASNNLTGIIDYAHTPDALKNVLQTIDEIRSRNEQLTCVVGCGGNRDAEKRPLMAAIACEYADRVILTSDNPRNENPEDILNEMIKGVPAQYFKKVLKISDREEAIKVAVSLSSSGDIILIAGKGHEKYQEIQGVKHPFDDKVKLQEAITLIN